MITMRIGKTRRRRVDWRLCLASSLMIVVIGFQAVPAGLAAAPAASGSAEVRIDSFSFSPSTLKVKVGTQVTWTNGDDIPHTVVSNTLTFRSKVLGTGEKFTFTAGKRGTYSYSCSIHPNMTGKVVVE
jgi:plastocyanin